MTVYVSTTKNMKQHLGYSDAEAPIPASGIKVFLSQEDCDRRKVARMEDKDGQIIRRGINGVCRDNR